MKVALTIAGSDPTGGAGIQADLRTFASFHVHGTAVIASLTIQSTLGIQEVVKIPPDLLRKQITTLLDDVTVHAVKTGMLLDGETIEIIGELLKKYRLTRYVLDPIIRSSTGFPVLKKDDIELLKKTLLPRALLVTPNLQEAEALTGLSVRTEKEMEHTAKEIRAMGPRYVLVKGGHLEGNAALDLLAGRSGIQRFRKPHVPGRRLHGAGCVYSAAITAGLAAGLNVEQSIRKAKGLVYRAIRSAVSVGQGRQLLNLTSD
ncbi:MAG: bifunctional hydroxymethylpyrimidine kinase/phosphomethylpyrimidine kinase [Nitrospirae bacterium]|nr:bifunctional hydroxymethylpyrimidine kinase/phosphomethylpyrimidine kinase [Nitrospirota bacterium]